MPRDAKLEDVVRRLDVLISLALDGVGGAAAVKPSAKIYRLADLGIPQSEIAGMVGKPPNYVGAVLQQRRARKKAKP